MRVTFNIGITGCTDYDIHIIKGAECFLYPCEIDSKTGDVTVELIPGCTSDLCIEGVVICNDGCESCTKDFRKCLCTEIGDCTEPCTECINGLCETVCEPDEYCVDDKCVECRDDNDCPADKECRNGECKCPIDKPYIHPETGKCVECIPGTIVDCYICNDGVWEEIDCGTGVCDPETDECVECNNSGDCDGVNECCIDKECKCCPGFVRNPDTGLCEPGPQCEVDTDCEKCEICVAGQCVPLECPEGYVCENGECVWNPCPDVPCKDGTDCGPGCGCDGEFCQPCRNLDCNTLECEQTLGCECEGTRCIETVDCDTPCSVGADCPDGCGCDDGICKDCTNYDCDQCLEIDGCACVSGKCQDDPGDTCNDTLTITKLDCGIRGILTKEESCACPALTVTSEISERVVVGDANYIKVKHTLRKGIGETIEEAKMLPRLDDTTHPDILENDTPILGTAKILIKPFYREVFADGSFSIVGGAIQEYTFNVAGIAEFTFEGPAGSSGILIREPGTLLPDTTNFFVEYTDIECSFVGNLTFDNECTYNPGTFANKTIDEAGQLDDLSTCGEAAVLTTSDTRDPIFWWYKAAGNSFSSDDIFRKGYRPRTGASYIDDLFGPEENTIYDITPDQGEIWAGYAYQLEADCTCNPLVGIDKLQICDVQFAEGTNFELKECKTVFYGRESDEPCPINKDLDLYRSDTYQIPEAAQTYYELSINGSVVESFKYNDTLSEFVAADGTLFSNFTYDAGQAITSITWGQNHGDDCDINLSFPEEDIVPEYDIDCTVGETTYQVTIPKSQSGGLYIVTNVEAGDNVTGIEEETDAWIARVKKTDSNGNQAVGTLIITFSNECTKTITVSKNCCEDADLSISVDNDCNQLPVLNFIPTGGNPVAYFEITLNGEILEANYPSATYTVVGGEFGEYTVTAFPCDVSATATVQASPVIELTVEGDGAYCGDEQATLTLTFTNGSGAASPDVDGAVILISGIPYTITGNTLVIDEITTTTTFSIGELTTFGGGCTVDFDIDYIVTFSEAPVINTISVVTPICVGATTTVTVDGQPGASVDILNLGSGYVIPASGILEIDTPPITAAGSIDYTVTAAYIGQSGSCDADPMALPTTSLTVNSNPTITFTSAQCDSGLNGIDIVFSSPGNTVTCENPFLGVVTSPLNIPLTSLPNSSTALSTLEFTVVSPAGCVIAETLDVPNVCDCDLLLEADPGFTTATSGQLVEDDTNQYTLQMEVGVPSTLTVVPDTGIGTAPYTYSWNTFPVNTGNFVNIPANTTRLYQCTITDANGCTGVVSIAVTAANCAALNFNYTVNGALNIPSLDLISGSNMDVIIPTDQVTGLSAGATAEYNIDSPGFSGSNVANFTPTVSGTASLAVRDTLNGCIASDSFDYNVIDCLEVNNTISGVQTHNYYEGIQCCSVITSFIVDALYAQYISEIFINGLQVAEFTVVDNLVTIIDMFPICEGTGGNPDDFELEMVLTVDDDSCQTPAYTVISPECDCLAPSNPTLQISATNIEGDSLQTYAANSSIITGNTAYCDFQPSMIPWRLTGLANNAVVTVAVTDLVSGETGGLVLSPYYDNGFWYLDIASLTCTSDVRVVITASQCSSSFIWEVRNICQDLAVEILPADLTESCDNLTAVATGGGGVFVEGDYSWEIVPDGGGGPFASTGTILDPSGFLSPGQSATITVTITDPTCNYSRTDTVVYETCPYTGLNITFNVVDPGRICDRNAQLTWEYTADCDSVLTGDIFLNGSDVGNWGAAGSGCLANTNNSVTVTSGLLVSGVNTYEFKQGGSTVASTTFTPDECDASGLDLVGGLAGGTCTGGTCSAGGTIQIRQTLGCAPFETDGNEDVRIFNVTTGAFIGPTISGASITYAGGPTNCSSTILGIASVNAIGTCPPNTAGVTLELRGATDVAGTGTVYASGVFSATCNP